jgi:hypothetical protein
VFGCQYFIPKLWVNPKALKIASLLTTFFYQQKHLSLPGIGSFQLDPAASIPDSSDKSFAEVFQHIHFTQKNIARPDDELIDYIRSKTGKIKPLAESDLDSFVSDGKLLLNIGKPFHIDGIGTLQKGREGLEFIAGGPMLEKIDMHRPQVVEEKITKNKPVYGEDFASQEAQHNWARKLLIGAVVLVGISIVVGGGYFLYNRSLQDKNENQQVQAATEIKPDSLSQTPPDTSTVKKDTVVAAPVVASGSYKYVFETTDLKQRALKRYSVVHQLSSRIQMETKDSLIFKIYTVLPSANAADTTWKKDSLNTWYWGVRQMKVKIEY